MPEPGLVFDLDGTLIDSAPDIHAAVNHVFAMHGLSPLSFAQVRGFIGNGVGVLLERCLNANGLPPDGALHARLSEDFIEIYETAYTLTSLYPGVEAALTAVSSHPMAICTNKPEGPTRSVLQHFGILHRFPVIVGGDTLPQRKPDPAPLQEAIRRLDHGPVFFVGDSEVDAETARRAGVPLLLFTGGYRKAAPETLGAEVIFDDWGDFAEIVSKLRF